MNLEVTEVGLDVSGSLEFGEVPLGRQRLRNVGLTNLLSSPIDVEVEAGRFLRSGWTTFQIPAGQSRELTVSFGCDERGLKATRLVVTADSLERHEFVATAQCGTARVELTDALDAGLVSPCGARAHERRGLSLRNTGIAGLDPVLRASADVPVRVSPVSRCDPALAVPAGFNARLAADVAPGQEGTLDLFISPQSLDRSLMVCPIEVSLGEEWHPVTVSFIGNQPTPTLNGGSFQFLPVDGGMDITILPVWPPSAPDTLYMSWPRLEVEDAGLRLVAAWSEAIVPAGSFVRLRVETTPGLPLSLPNTVLVDGNTLSGTFRYIIVP